MLTSGPAAAVEVAVTLTVRPKALVPLLAICVLLVQVMTLLAAVHVQLPDCAPDKATAPLGIVLPVGSTSTTVIVPLVELFPLLVTVSV